MAEQQELLEGPRAYQALVVIKGIEACKIGMRLNTSYTPTNLKRTAEHITGRKLKRGDYDGWVAAIRELLPPTEENPA